MKIFLKSFIAHFPATLNDAFRTKFIFFLMALGHHYSHLL